MSHTKGKLNLYIQTDSGEIEVDTLGLQIGGEPIAMMENIGEEETIANAHRLAACWNACEGIPTESLTDNIIKQVTERALERETQALAQLDHERGVRRIALEALSDIRQWDGAEDPCGEMADKAIKEIIQRTKKKGK